MAVTVIGEDIGFGLDGNYAGLAATTSVTATFKRDKKELKSYDGTLKAIAYFNPTVEYTIEGYGFTSIGIGSSITAPDFGGGGSGTVVVEEVTFTKTNEDFLKSSVKAVRYEEI
jgi:hypothetical protein